MLAMRAKKNIQKVPVIPIQSTGEYRFRVRASQFQSTGESISEYGLRVNNQGEINGRTTCMVRGVLRWNGGTTGGARVSQVAQVTAGTELWVQPVLPVVRCVPVVVTTTHASRMLSGGLAQPASFFGAKMPRSANHVRPASP